MAKSKSPKYRVKLEYVARVRFESRYTSILLDKTTPQAVLASFYGTSLGKGFIELVTTAPAVVTQPNDNGTEAGQ